MCNNTRIDQLPIRDKISHILNKGYQTSEKQKKHGEVFTPFPLIEEMLDKLPQEIWSDKTKTWLDPAAGIGNFHAIVLERLEANGISRKWALENQLFFIEYNELSAKLIKRIFDPQNEFAMNIICGDALTINYDKLTLEDWKNKI